MATGPLPWVDHELNLDNPGADLVLPTTSPFELFGETFYEVPVGPSPGGDG